MNVQKREFSEEAVIHRVYRNHLMFSLYLPTLSAIIYVNLFEENLK